MLDGAGGVVYVLLQLFGVRLELGSLLSSRFLNVMSKLVFLPLVLGDLRPIGVAALSLELLELPSEGLLGLGPRARRTPRRLPLGGRGRLLACSSHRDAGFRSN